jgi:hypothetical protein
MKHVVEHEQRAEDVEDRALHAPHHEERGERAPAEREERRGVKGEEFTTRS